MKFKKGDKVIIRDRSYCFGLQSGEYSCDIPNSYFTDKIPLTVIHADTLKVRNNYNDRYDMVVTDGEGGFWFVMSSLCTLAHRKITVKFFDENNRDVTSKIIEETKRNLLSD